MRVGNSARGEKYPEGRGTVNDSTIRVERLHQELAAKTITRIHEERNQRATIGMVKHQKKMKMAFNEEETNERGDKDSHNLRREFDQIGPDHRKHHVRNKGVRKKKEKKKDALRIEDEREDDEEKEKIYEIIQKLSQREKERREKEAKRKRELEEKRRKEAASSPDEVDSVEELLAKMKVSPKFIQWLERKIPR